MTSPWSIDEKDVTDSGNALMVAFKNSKGIVPIALEDIETEYCRLMNLDYPIPEMAFVRSWMLFRVSTCTLIVWLIIHHRYCLVGCDIAGDCCPLRASTS